MDGLKRLRVKKQYGVWYYKKITPAWWDDVDGVIWELYDADGKFINNFPFFADMKIYVEDGIII